MHSRNYEISSLERRAETRQARNSDRKSLLFQRNSFCPKERCKKSWVADLTNYCQSHSSHSAASFPSNYKMGAYIRRMSVPVDRHFPSETLSHWNIGGLATLAVILTSVLWQKLAIRNFHCRIMQCDLLVNYFCTNFVYDYNI